MEDPRVLRSRARIIDAARHCFAEQGYRDTSVADVAARAGITKRTIYNLYEDKEALFRTALEASIAIAETFIADLVAEIEDVAEATPDLPHLAVRLADDVLIGQVTDLRRLVATEAAEFPDLAQRYRTGAPEAVLAALATAFGALTERGQLAAEGPELAAEHFAFLVMGADLDRRMLGAPPVSAARVRRKALAGAQTFLRAYGAQP